MRPVQGRGVLPGGPVPPLSGSSKQVARNVGQQPCNQIQSRRPGAWRAVPADRPIRLRKERLASLWQLCELIPQMNHRCLAASASAREMAPRSKWVRYGFVGSIGRHEQKLLARRRVVSGRTHPHFLFRTPRSLPLPPPATGGRGIDISLTLKLPLEIEETRKKMAAPARQQGKSVQHTIQRGVEIIETTQSKAIRLRLIGWLLEIDRLAAFESSGVFLRASRAL